MSRLSVWEGKTPHLKGRLVVQRRPSWCGQALEAYYVIYGTAIHHGIFLIIAVQCSMSSVLQVAARLFFIKKKKKTSQTGW